MNFLKLLELGMALSLLGWRLIVQPAARWPFDVAVVVVLLWIGLACAGDRARFRAGFTIVAAIWLIVIYALSQGPHTLRLFLE